MRAQGYEGRIGSWLRYTGPVSIAGMLTMVVGMR